MFPILVPKIVFEIFWYFDIYHSILKKFTTFGFVIEKPESQRHEHSGLLRNTFNFFEVCYQNQQLFPQKTDNFLGVTPLQSSNTPETLSYWGKCDWEPGFDHFLKIYSMINTQRGRMRGNDACFAMPPSRWTSRTTLEIILYIILLAP